MDLCSKMVSGFFPGSYQKVSITALCLCVDEGNQHEMDAPVDMGTGQKGGEQNAADPAFGHGSSAQSRSNSFGSSSDTESMESLDIFHVCDSFLKIHAFSLKRSYERPSGWIEPARLVISKVIFYPLWPHSGKPSLDIQLTRRSLIVLLDKLNMFFRACWRRKRLFATCIRRHRIGWRPRG